MNASDLMLSLHRLDVEKLKIDLKRVIAATTYLFAQKAVYSQELLTVILMQLSEQTPLPKLLMRSCLLSLQQHPKIARL